MCTPLPSLASLPSEPQPGPSPSPGLALAACPQHSSSLLFLSPSPCLLNSSFSVPLGALSALLLPGTPPLLTGPGSWAVVAASQESLPTQSGPRQSGRGGRGGGKLNSQSQSTWWRGVGWGGAAGGAQASEPVNSPAHPGGQAPAEPEEPHFPTWKTEAQCPGHPAISTGWGGL